MLNPRDSHDSSRLAQNANRSAVFLIVTCIIAFLFGLFLSILPVISAVRETDSHKPYPPDTLAQPSLASLTIQPGLSVAGQYRAQVLRVIDGDTIEARIAIWLGNDIVSKIRLRGIDAPEMNGACAWETQQAAISRKRLQALIGQGSILLTEIGGDKYFGRVLARVLTPSGSDVGPILLAEGLARPYYGGKRSGWCGKEKA
jgi:micrococcal nuclease